MQCNTTNGVLGAINLRIENLLKMNKGNRSIKILKKLSWHRTLFTVVNIGHQEGILKKLHVVYIFVIHIREIIILIF